MEEDTVYVESLNPIYRDNGTEPAFYRSDALPVANQQCQSTELSFIELCKYKQCIRTWQYLITVLMQSTHSCNILDT